MRGDERMRQMHDLAESPFEIVHPHHLVAFRDLVAHLVEDI
jgi:hypothetical protein